MVESGEMLIGEHLGTIGEKNRVALPKKIRDELGNKLIIAQGYEKSLIIVSMNLWEELIKPISDQPFLASSVRDTTRFLVGSATEIELDDQGRFIIPQVLKDYAELNKEVSFIGLLKWVEIWDQEKWNEKRNFLVENSSQIAEELNNAARKV